MPHLLILAPCEKVIIAQDENTPTLIALLQDIGAEYQIVGKADTSSESSQSLVIPMLWTIFTIWRADDSDKGKVFIQTIKVTTQTGKTIIENPYEFSMEKATQRIILRLQGFPIAGGSGTWMIQVFLNEKGQSVPSEPTGSYPIDVRLVERKLDEAASGNV